MVVILFSSQLTAFAGDHRGVVTPVPIPNTEVKRPIAEGSAGLACARVGRRRLFYLFLFCAVLIFGICCAYFFSLQKLIREDFIFLLSFAS